MSRVGKQELQIPKNTEVAVDGGVVRVKGPNGELSKRVHDEVVITVSDSTVTFKPKKETLQSRALWGTVASHVKNMLHGVNEPFSKKLIVEGVGFRVELRGKELVMSLGFSHPVVIPVPEGITVVVEKNEITISGIDKEAVGQFAANIRKVKKPEPYKGKGIRYHDEVVLRKQGKKAA